MEDSAALDLADLDGEGTHDILDHIVLEVEDVGDRPGIALRPDIASFAAVDEADIDPEIPLDAADRALEHIADVEIVRDLQRRDSLAPVRIHRIGGKHGQLAELRQVGDQIVEDAFDDRLGIGLAAEIDEGQDGDRNLHGAAPA